MATLQIDFEDAYKRVSDFLGLGTTPTGTNLTKVKDIVHRAYRKFLFPISSQTGQIYIWSFVRKTGTIVTQANKYQYALPDDFVGLVSGFKYDAGEDKDNPQRIDISKLRALRSQSVTAAANPEYYAINSNPYDKETGFAYEVWFYRPLSGSVTFKYEYIFDPKKPEENADLFVGGVRASEVIMQIALSIAELQEDDVVGPQTTEAEKMLSALIAYDQTYIPNAIEVDPEITESIPIFRRDKLMRMVTSPGGE